MKRNITIDEAVKLFLTDRARYYSRNGSTTRQWNNVKSYLQPLVSAHGAMELHQLDAPLLSSLLDGWIEEGRLARETINKRLYYVRGLVKFCRKRGFGSAEQLVDLEAVEPIPANRYGFRKRPKIQSARSEDIQLVLEELTDPMRDLIEMIRITGMRPGEARLMRLGDLKRIQHKGRPVFRYTLKLHKTEHHGKGRKVFIHGEAFDLMVKRISTLAGETLFDQDTEGYIFSPGNDGKKPYGEWAVPQAVRRACKKVGVKFTPNQVRKTYATQNKSEGMLLGQIAELLGHSNPKTTEIYIDDEVLEETEDRTALEAVMKIAS